MSNFVLSAIGLTYNRDSEGSADQCVIDSTRVVASIAGVKWGTPYNQCGVIALCATQRGTPCRRPLISVILLHTSLHCTREDENTACCKLVSPHLLGVLLRNWSVDCTNSGVWFC